METKYEQLRTRINELLPDRVKLEFGCEVIALHQHSGQTFHDHITSTRTVSAAESGGIGYGNAVIGAHRIEHGFLQSDDKRIRGRRDFEDIFPLIEILGKPLTIEDVLRALHVRPKHIAVYISDSGQIMTVDAGEYETDTGFYFRLGLPLSAPENDEACGAVLDLLK